MEKVYEYLKILKQSESLEKKQILEFYCKTCKLASDPLMTQYFVDRTPIQSKIYIVPKFRKTIPLGIIFTKNSMIAKPHFEGTAKDHNWGQYQPEIISFRDKKEKK